MKGRELVASFPERPTREREEKILDAVKRGFVRPIRWAQVHAYSPGHEAVLEVMADALALGDESDFVRLNVNHTTAQRIADVLGAALPTSRISDLANMQATVRLRPCLQTPDAMIAHTSRMIRHSACVEERRAGREGLASTVGKDWVLTNRLVGHPDHAANYGWHDPSAPNGRVWQPVGLAHDRWHVDYSQVVRLVRPTVIVDGTTMPLADVLVSPELSPLVSSEGPLAVTRHPGVPLQDDRADAPVVATPPATDLETAHIPFVGAIHFRRSSARSIDWIVLHTAEVSELQNAARGVAAGFALPGGPTVSAHYCVDARATVQCVHEEDVAFHARGANDTSIGIELAGRAAQTTAEWDDPYSRDMLDRAARLVADICRRRMIPAALVDAAGLQAGARGITTHADVSRAFRRSTHTDPGPRFPMQAFLARVRMYLQASSSPAPGLSLSSSSAPAT